MKPKYFRICNIHISAQQKPDKKNRACESILNQTCEYCKKELTVSLSDLLSMLNNEMKMNFAVIALQSKIC